MIESTGLPPNSEVPAAFTSFSDSNLLVVSLAKDTRQHTLEVANRLSRHTRAPISLILEG